MIDADELVPPTHLLFDGTRTAEEFKSVGEGATRYFLIEHARLLPSEKVLDVGCGLGQKARPLASYLNQSGSYDGLDIVPAAIEWCVEHYKRFPHFRFQLADLRNVCYNPTGTSKASEYRFPYDDGTFDLVLLSSVFTHLLPDDMTRYFSEIARVLKVGGRSVITYFLLNPESLRRIDAKLDRIKIPFRYSATCRIADRDVPEAAVAHDERTVRSLYDRNGLSVTEMTYGSWCGRRELVGSLQDVVIAVKE